MLKARFATALVLLGIFLSALFVLQTKNFAILIAAVVAIGSFEWAGLAKASDRVRLIFCAFCTGTFVWAIWGVGAIDPAQSGMAALYGLSAIFWLFAVPAWLALGVRFRSLGPALLIGVLVVIPAGLSVVSLHSIHPGLLLMLLALIWIADTAAYFTGRAFGRHKLAPAISPGKTWEGVAGAVVATQIYATVCALFWPEVAARVQETGWVLFLAIAGLLCVVSITGDLFESSVKRQAQIKDSGTFLPGHGGVLDRIDSITSTLPVASLIYYFIVRSA